jgi:hypothetical protein
MSMFHFPTLAVADEIGLFALLHDTPRTKEDVTKLLAIGERAAEALLGVLTSLGYLLQLNGMFYLSEVSRTFLLPYSRYYWGGILRLMRSNPLTFEALLNAIRQDKATIYQEQNVWETHEVEPEQARIFTAHMHSQTVAPAVGAARRGPFQGVKRLLDVGGGSGVFCFPLVREYPEMHCTVLDLPVVCNIAREYIAREGLQDRVDTVSADFFKEPLPIGYDALLWSNIFHDWGREKCLHLARRSFEALPSGGRIYLHEIPLHDSTIGPLHTASFSVCLFWVTEGKQYSVAELEEMLVECGFHHLSVTPTYGHYMLISARKP